MFFVILKKEFKQFFRNKGKLVMLFLFPIILITILGFALNNVMGGSSDKIFDNEKVFYTISEDSKYESGFNAFKDGMKKEFKTLDFNKISNDNDSIENAKQTVLNNKAFALITITKDGYDYFRNENLESTDAKIFRSIFEGIINKYKLTEVAVKVDPSYIQKIIQQENKNFITEKSVGSRSVSSIDYYTFAELALIILYISMQVGESVVNERELSTIDRIKLSKTKSLTVILSKVCFGFILSILQIITVYLYSTLVLKANWGTNLAPMFLNLMCLGLFASVFGATIGSTLRDGKAMLGILNTVIVIMCLFGGSYTPLSVIKSIPGMGALTNFSPVYWINSALISLSTGVKDTYTTTFLSITLGASFILVCIYLISRSIKRRDGLV